MRTIFFSVATAMLLVFNSTLSVASPSSQALVSEGVKILFQNDNIQNNVILAAAKFREAIYQDSSDQEANFYYATVRILSIMDNSLPYSSGAPIENMRELLDRLGVSSEGRDIFNWTATFQEDGEGDVIFPPSAPTLGEMQQFIFSALLTEIDGALINLSRINSKFNIVTHMPPSDPDSAELEIDYGDVLAYKATLYVMRSIFVILSSYDLNTSIEPLQDQLRKDTFSIQNLLKEYSNFLKFVPEGPSKIAMAKSDIINAIDTYIEASTFIRAEGDAQENDLLSLQPIDFSEEEAFKTELDKIKTSLNTNIPVVLREASTPINFGQFFNHPLTIRNYLPQFGSDNRILCWTYPDPTFSGIFPTMTQSSLSNCDDVILNTDLSLDIYSLDIFGSLFDIKLTYYINPFDSTNHYWKLEYYYESYDNTDHISSSLNEDLSIIIHVIEIADLFYKVKLSYYRNSNDPLGLYWKLESIETI